MNIVLGTDDKYAVPCSVCIISIFENNKDLDCSIFILTEGLTEQNLCMFNDISQKYNRKISVLKIDDKRFNNLKTVKGRFSKAMYNRFLIAEILKDQKTALYLDCDIIVNGSLSFIDKLSIDSYACAVVKDQMCGDLNSLNNRIGIDTPYFNSGVLLMNLIYWRKYDISKRCIDYIYKFSEECLFPDQDALNKVLSGKVLYLQLTYNFQERFYLKSNNKFCDTEMLAEIQKYKDNPIVIHFTDPIKPWYKECQHPLKNLFYLYCTKSPYKFKIKRYYNLSRYYKIIKSKFKRIVYFLTRKISRT